MRISNETATLYVPVQLAAALLALLFAVGSAFMLWLALDTLGETATASGTYRAFVTSFQPVVGLSQALGISLEAADFVSRLFLVAMLAAIAAFFVQLGLLVNAARMGAPFSRANAGRLAWMGWSLILAFGVCEGLVAILFADPTFDQWAIIGLLTLMGFVFLVLAKVFRHGVALAEDLEGTV